MAPGSSLICSVVYKDIYPTYTGSILMVSQRLHLQIPSHQREEFIRELEEKYTSTLRSCMVGRMSSQGLCLREHWKSHLARKGMSKTLEIDPRASRSFLIISQGTPLP